MSNPALMPQSSNYPSGAPLPLPSPVQQYQPPTGYIQSINPHPHFPPEMFPFHATQQGAMNYIQPIVAHMYREQIPAQQLNPRSAGSPRPLTQNEKNLNYFNMCLIQGIIPSILADTSHPGYPFIHYTVQTAYNNLFLRLQNDSLKTSNLERTLKPYTRDQAKRFNSYSALVSNLYEVMRKSRGPRGAKLDISFDEISFLTSDKGYINSLYSRWISSDAGRFCDEVDRQLSNALSGHPNPVKKGKSHFYFSVSAEKRALENRLKDPYLRKEARASIQQDIDKCNKVMVGLMGNNARSVRSDMVYLAGQIQNRHKNDYHSRMFPNGHDIFHPDKIMTMKSAISTVEGIVDKATRHGKRLKSAEISIVIGAMDQIRNLHIPLVSASRVGELDKLKDENYSAFQHLQTIYRLLYP